MRTMEAIAERAMNRSADSANRCHRGGGTSTRRGRDTPTSAVLARLRRTSSVTLVCSIAVLPTSLVTDDSIVAPGLQVSENSVTEPSLQRVVTDLRHQALPLR